MNKKIIAILFVFFIFIFSLFVVIKVLSEELIIGSNKTNEDNKEISHEEYIYKEDLLVLGYSIDEIKIIENKISNVNIKNYLLSNKYNNLINFVSSPYFVVSNIGRYQSYYDKNNYSFDEVVIHVEIGLDYNYYTNVISSNLEDNNLILVNKYNSLSSNYIPNMDKLDSKYGVGYMMSDAYNQFKKMCDDALKDNISLKSVSSYRSYTTQFNLYDKYVKRDGKEKADTYSARAGHSEHQTGLEEDINTSYTSDHFENSNEYYWLINNSYKYGFILRYPKDKEYITGYKYEPWHFRYVGIDPAFKIFEEKITFEEYYIKYVKNS